MKRLSRYVLLTLVFVLTEAQAMAGMFSGPFRPTSRHPFLVFSAGYATHYRSELGLGLAIMEPGQSGAMMVFAQALRLKIADLDPDRLGLSYDFGGVGVMNLYFGAAAYTDESYHAHICVGFIGNLCVRLGGTREGPNLGLAAELIL